MLVKYPIVTQLKIAFPGVSISVLIAVAAQFLSEHYGAPAMLMALLLGLALNFLSEEGTQTAPGVAIASKTILRLGVALLGARISVDMLSGLGGWMIILIISGVVATILFALAASRLFGRGWGFALLTGGSVAICGASAAMAIASVLPKTERSERDLIFTVLSVTVLSTVAMILYPILSQALGFSSRAAGVFLGGTIHDVAQVVGAGFSIDNETGENATLVKLVRVAMLAPVVLAISIVVRPSETSQAPDSQKRQPLLPRFLIGFLVLAGVNSVGFIPDSVGNYLAEISRWALLISIAAVGIKTSLKKILGVGPVAIALIVLETLFLGSFILGGLQLLV
ncbi:YeiH family protein [Novosphingobium resinovorum]|uniref:Sulfate exporter family transporter n=1 Tax=Novosphingobium resinovorum TaxID=158500 RepID=A0A1D8AGH4_9SPHN|nr:YeiH family protein [Novosphingobium resinovorum]AOR81199.1 hypothetical protein BES08_30485 [Novosphingobium resinovorum]